MRTILLFLLLCARTVLGADFPPGGLELPNGTRVIVENGNVRVEAGAGTRAQSVSSSVNVRSDGTHKVATVTSERDGRREERTIVISPDGKVTVREAADEPPATAAKPGGAWLGVHCSAVPPTLRAHLDIAANEGLLIERVAPDGPAVTAGLMENDLLLALDSKTVGDLAALRAELANRKPGTPITIDYLRKGRRDSVRLMLAERTAPEDSGIGAAMNKLKTQQPSSKTQSRTTVIGPNGQATTVEGGPDDAFDAILKDPNVPESFKETVRKQREQMRKFMEGHQGKAPH